MSYVVEKKKVVVSLLLCVFWIVGGFPFFCQELAFSLYEKINPFLLLLADVVVIFLGIITLRKKNDIFIVVSFFTLAYISTCVLNGASVIQFLNGIRHYISLIFLVPIFRYCVDDIRTSSYYVDLIDRHLYAFLWLQLPCTIIQCVLYGAFDKVGGSLGWMYSGEISTLVYLISIYFMRKRWDINLGYIANIRKNIELIVLLLPSFLNETKISFIYFVLYFFFIMPLDRKLLIRVLVLAPCVAMIMPIMGSLYISLTGSSENTLTTSYMEEYLWGNADGQEFVEFLLENGSEVIDEELNDFARFAKFGALQIIMEEQPQSYFWGFGVGQFKGGSLLDQTELYKEYEWLFVGVRMTFYQVLMELGILGLVWFVGVWVVLFKEGNNTRSLPMTIYLVILWVIIGVYNAAFCNLAFSVVFMYILYRRKLDIIK